MKKLWFKRKKYGWGWTFGTWESVVVMFLYVTTNIFIFLAVDNRSHSSSDTLINFAPRFLMLTAVLYLICWWKGEKPKWQLRNRTWRRSLQVGRDDVVASVLRQGKIVVIPTDTTYGVVGSAMNEKAVNEIYRLRKRDLDKPFIVLIADRKELKKFGVRTTPAQEKILSRVWPGSVSIILSCVDEKFSYLHRGKNTLAFRVPANAELSDLLRKTGPLVAPSANPQGHHVSKNISEARAYFGHHISFYQDGGDVSVSPSRLIDITDGTEKILRS